MKKILFTGGGSAGHVVPNLALMEELAYEGKTELCYMGTNGVEKDLVCQWKLPFYEIKCPKLVRGGGVSAWKNNLKIPFSFLRAVRQAEKGLREFAPDAVFSKGGYVALPVVFASKRLGIPCFAHESDFTPGLANKLSARKCEKVFTSFPETAHALKNGEFSGAPMRRTLFAPTRAEGRRYFDIPSAKKVLLIFGGGSGSQKINDAVRASLKELLKEYIVLHVTGKGKRVHATMQGYRQFEFIADMGMAYACADVIVARAGAGTVFETLALKKRALFIPLEGATRGDQVQNAEYFQRKGLCHVLREGELSLLPKALRELENDRALSENLASSNFTSGNERILSALKKRLLT